MTDELTQALIAKAKAETALVDAQRQQIEDDMRPHRRYGAVLTRAAYLLKGPESKFPKDYKMVWYCGIMNSENQFQTTATATFQSPLAAWGKTPEEACKNFDDLWTNGYKHHRAMDQLVKEGYLDNL